MREITISVPEEAMDSIEMAAKSAGIDAECMARVILLEWVLKYDYIGVVK